jgi:predicted ATPase
MSIIVFNSGAGAVGKTSVVAKTLELAPSFDRNVVSLPSVTRSVYARLGYPTEKAATELTFEQQWELQMAIQQAYYEAIKQFITSNPTADLVMIDRSPLDHVSYLFHNLAFKLSLKDCLFQMNRAWAFLVEVLAMQEVNDVWIVHYKFPDHWHVPKDGEDTANASSDGFRFDAGGKNLLWALTLEALLARTEREVVKRWPEMEQLKDFNVTSWSDDCSSIEDRAKFILTEFV